MTDSVNAPLDDDASRVLSYASPRTDRKFGRGFLDLPPPGRVVAEIAAAALLLSLYREPEKFIWSFYLTAVIIACLLVRALIQWLRSSAANDYVDAGWWRTLRWVTLLLLVLNIRYDVCPHARYLHIGPAQFTWGEHCGNPRNYRNVLGMLLDPPSPL